ncbi:aminotransferase class IV [Brevibacterium sp. FAM 25378]|uniref:aminotransferase class IV n=1 Tax=Brevibacterium sp. FAM 25378 TaxID=3415682 RepID=UPI001091B0FE|nr:aminotransferase class IV [Brevibacterium sp. S22]
MTVWVWDSQESRFEEAPEDVGTWTLLAADSWLVEEGQVRAFERHRARFADAAVQVGVGALVTAEFWASVVEKIPEAGEWFPRVDVLETAPGGTRVLALRLRPAPPRTHELGVLIPPYFDPRSTPGRKGPDIAMLENLRTQAREEYDCDEVLLLSKDGYVIEGATTSLLWWDGDTLCAPDPALGALPGVTSALILNEARVRSIPVEYHQVRPEVLIRHEAWLVNALHGIRRVYQLVDTRTDSSPVHVQSATAVVFGRWREWMNSRQRRFLRQ